MAMVAHFSLACAELARGGYLLNVGVRAEYSEERDGLLGLLDQLDDGADDKGTPSIFSMR